MLHSIKIKNYRSLKNIELELTPLTVLIGPNASGKSNLLDIFSLFSEAAYGVLGNALNKRGGFSNLVYRSQMQKEISFQFDFSFSESEIKDITRYEIQMQQQGAYCIIENEIISQLNNSDISILLKRESWECHLKNNNQSENTTSIRNNAELAITQVIDANNYPISYQILEELKNWTIYNLAINDDLRIPQWAKSTTRLNSTGDNLIQVLHTIKELYPKTWENIEGHLENIYENFYRIGFPAEGGDGKLWMRFWEKPFEKGKGFSINFLSDGTLRFLCLLAILESPDPPPLICIEEPELGLHPEWIGIIAELLQIAATRTQLIITTHSPQLISKLKPEEIVIVEKENGETVANRLSKEELKDWLKDFTLGDLWLAGDLGG